jgi:hypothetical protein
MNYTTSTTAGIDTVIKSIQTELYDELVLKWVDDIDGYGRVSRTDTGDGVVPRYYLSENDYKDVYYDDSKSGQFFFLTSEDSSTEDEDVYHNDVKVVFMVDLTRMLGTDRQDELARTDVVKILRSISDNRFEITGIETGVKNVFRGLDSEKVNKADTHPLHTFSVKIKLSYYIPNKLD